jgi:hypothetical protein
MTGVAGVIAKPDGYEGELQLPLEIRGRAEALGANF